MRSPPATRRRGRCASQSQPNEVTVETQEEKRKNPLRKVSVVADSIFECGKGDEDMQKTNAHVDHVSSEMAGDQKLGSGTDNQGHPEIVNQDSETSKGAQMDPGTIVYCKGGPGQVVCGNPVEDGQSGIHRGIQCDKCSDWFHASCQVVPPEAVQAMDDFPILIWLCAECKPTLPKQSRVSERISQLESRLAGLDLSLKEHMKLVQGSLKEQEIAVAQQTEMIKRSIKEQSLQTTSYADAVRGSCAEVVASVKSSLDSGPTKPQPVVSIGSQAAKEISGMLDSYMDKEKRKCNVVVFNLPEEAGETHAERVEKDIEKFRDIIKNELHLNIRVTRAFRTGRGPAGKPRLLIVTLENQETKAELLKLASQLRSSREWHSLFINPDLTQSEREAGKKLREELARRRADGELNLFIRQGKIIRGQAQLDQVSGARPKAPPSVIQQSQQPLGSAPDPPGPAAQLRNGQGQGSPRAPAQATSGAPVEEVSQRQPTPVTGVEAPVAAATPDRQN